MRYKTRGVRAQQTVFMTYIVPVHDLWRGKGIKKKSQHTRRKMPDKMQPYIEDFFQVVRANVLVLEVVRMFPNIKAQKRGLVASFTRKSKFKSFQAIPTKSERSAYQSRRRAGVLVCTSHNLKLGSSLSMEARHKASE